MQTQVAHTPPDERRAAIARRTFDFVLLAMLWGLGPVLYAAAFLWFLLA